MEAACLREKQCQIESEKIREHFVVFVVTA